MTEDLDPKLVQAHANLGVALTEKGQVVNGFGDMPNTHDMLTGSQMDGRVYVGGAKNSALKLMAAALLAPGRSVVRNVPNILDVAVMGDLLRRLGCTVEIEHPLDADPTTGSTSGTATIDVPETAGPDD